ncbi:YihY/virulence factor BrkB family protein [Acaryochloris sp. IP29b_bin.148]|uniref:YihY/virulence factor BrkB family protein n=1 Tax=Acaryochloris sp. IP29b_bin.148 TaxID=2969218 RepID=UPI00260466CD|nr:YihY/virulence factor BrkB family protein [Acaryochloris sp. IP29b_bin.148]
MSFDNVFWLLKVTGLEWQRDKASRLAAALAYYTAFSLAPVLVIVIAIASLAFNQSTVQGQVMAQFKEWLGPDGAAIIRVMVRGTYLQGSGMRDTLGSLVLLFVGSTGLFTNLKDALNSIWKIQPAPDRGWKGFVRDRLFAFVMVLGVGLVLILILGLSTWLTAVSHSASTYVSSWIHVGRILDSVFSLSIITFIVALIYKYLPDVEIQWSDVWIGSFLTSLLFAVGKFLISLYLSQNSLSSTYGAAGSLAVVLLWVNYSAQIFFFGAELTKVYTNRFGSQIRPARYATALQDPVTQPSPSQLNAQKAASSSGNSLIQQLPQWLKKVFRRTTRS